jgi:hypothetical protein
MIIANYQKLGQISQFWSYPVEGGAPVTVTSIEI